MSHWRNKGIFFGYPECCIQEFYNNQLPTRTDEYKEKYEATIFDETGYLPCEHCLERDPVDLIREINLRRKANGNNLNFPLEQNGYYHEEMIERFVKFYAANPEIRMPRTD